MIKRDILLETILDSERVDQFCQEAYILHDVTVNQKYDDMPYSYHLKSVVETAKTYVHLVAENTSDVMPIIFAAAFHDSIEDARLTYNDVMKIAEKHVGKNKAQMATEIVYALTNEKGRNRAERANDKYYDGIRNTKYAPFVKMCDRIANYTYSKEKGSSMAKKYEQEMEHFIHSIQEFDYDKCYYAVPFEMINLIDSK